MRIGIALEEALQAFDDWVLWILIFDFDTALF